MVLMLVTVPVSTPFGLKSGLDLLKIRSETAEHIFNHVVGPNAKNVISNFRRQMPIAQMPGEAHQLYRISVPDFYKVLGRGLNP